ncbi:hypothetical protein AMTR_s00052p00227890 [Amborella trichopoda]|uniref:Uncharacterized protein n=1 Tax=Amborella trichopoda TaxID=13333 RepID=U5D2K6_AMBTC|nr:hypothetical protein AMTR_s00052p00227890 [Amborella trichopoda]
MQDSRNSQESYVIKEKEGEIESQDPFYVEVELIKDWHNPVNEYFLHNQLPKSPIESTKIRGSTTRYELEYCLEMETKKTQAWGLEEHSVVETTKSQVRALEEDLEVETTKV